MPPTSSWPREISADAWPAPGRHASPGDAPLRSSPYAASGFVLSVLLPPLGMVLAAVALAEVRRSHGTVAGRGLAAAGMLIGALELCLFAIL